ncbi:MAG: M1 family aminopeptidase, partial [Bacteroidetes bacterium]|nr:M1 family aminopeptidase [Bacteroidota bacterium]
ADSIDITIHTPNGNRTATNGILVSTIVVGGFTEYHWKHRYPIAAYLVGIAVTNYASFTQQVPFGSDTLKVFNYIYPEDSATAVVQLPVIIPMIQVYDTLFGIYPFQREKYGHAQFNWGGGMEHQTMTFVANFQFELIAHELAHMWFGDKVTCGSWTDIWLNEGFATYLSGLIYEHLDPDLWVRFRMVRIQSITSQPGGSVYCPDTLILGRLFDSRLSYAKGAMILHQLRWIMGDSVFFAALSNYLNDYSLAYGFARTEDLKIHLESSYGHDLSWYFNDWFTGEGYPQYQINWSQTDDTVAFTVRQTQSSPAVAFFELPVQLKFKNPGHDTLIRFNNTFSGELFKVRIPFVVDSLIFDPLYQIISKNNSVNAVVEHDLRASLQVVPNPATDHVTFRFGGLMAGEHGTIRIYDDSGRMRDELFPCSGQNEITFGTQGYSPGLYFYVFAVRDYKCSGKFVISQ